MRSTRSPTLNRGITSPLTKRFRAGLLVAASKKRNPSPSYKSCLRSLLYNVGQGVPHMKAIIYSLLLLVFVIVAVPAAAYGNCYVLQNKTNYSIKLQFEYNGPVGLGSVVAVELAPNGHYPAKGQWCWNTREDQWAKVIIVSNRPYKPSWDGQLVLGNGGPAYPSGRYILNSPSPADDQRR
jgi:hypothetical protein